MALATDNAQQLQNTAESDGQRPQPSVPSLSQLSFARAVWPVVRFGLCIILISLALSYSVAPWANLPLWILFRRCVSIAAAISLWLSIRTFEGRDFRSYGLPSLGAGKRQLFFGLTLGTCALLLTLAIYLASGACRIEVTPDHAKLWRTILGFIPAAAIVGVLEELVFRGFILQHLLARSRILALVTSSALYAVVHLKTPTFGLLTGLELGGLFLLGGVLALSYLQTKQLYLAIGLHAALAYGARINKVVVSFDDPTIGWLVGTSRLVNGLLNWVVLVIVGIIVVWWARSSHVGGRHENVQQTTV